MRLPTQAEALGISGTSSASCAFPLPWSTWTSTPDPQNPGDAAFVTYTGQSSYQVADNFPGGVMCVEGTAGVAPPTITTQPTSPSVAVGATATFTVAATGTGTLTYQWYRNNSPIANANSASYTTAAVAASDNGALFSVTVTNSGVTVVSNQVTLTVTGGSCTAAPGTPGTLSSTTMGTTSIALSWGASTAEGTCPVNYDIYRSTAAGFTPSTASQIGMAQPGTTYTDTGLTPGTTYYYVVEAVDSSGASSPSNQASAMVPATGAPMPDFMLAVTPNAVTVATGSSTTTAVTVEPQNGFSTNSAVTFSCTGLPAGATCNFGAVSVSASGSMSSTLTINAATPTAAAMRAGSGLLLSGTSLAFALGFVRRRGRRGERLLMLLPLTVAVLTLFVGCSKTPTTATSTGIPTSGSSTTSTPSTVTVTATAGSVMHSTTFTLAVTSTASMN
jgi:fibronectin type 3 domain-containing protein